MRHVVAKQAAQLCSSRGVLKAVLRLDLRYRFNENLRFGQNDFGKLIDVAEELDTVTPTFVREYFPASYRDLSFFYPPSADSTNDASYAFQIKLKMLRAAAYRDQIRRALAVAICIDLPLGFAPVDAAAQQAIGEPCLVAL